jgi:branched-chain amino acid transport system substrate-binding protein
VNIKALNISKYKWLSNTTIFLLIIILTFFLARKNNSPIIIGYAAQLTGTQAAMGVQGRNGVQLAVETINESGGIAGRRLKLIYRDDFGISEKAQIADNELIKEGAIAIIGHVTSSQTLAGLKVTNPAKVVMLSPTVSTPELSGLKDYFFRVHPSFKDSSEAFAKYIYEHTNVKRMAIIYDLDNFEYTKTYSAVFGNRFKFLGGDLAGEIGFSSSIQPDFSKLLLEVEKTKPEGLLIIASDIDTALIAQRIRLMSWNVPLFATGWPLTETLINNGGQAVEGMKLEQFYTQTSQSPNFIDFKYRYAARFGNDPTFSAAYSYEAAFVLADALRKTGGKSEGLKEALEEIKDFNGLTDNFSLDEFGDVKRPYYLSTIKDGKVITIEKLASNNSGGE